MASTRTSQGSGTQSETIRGSDELGVFVDAAGTLFRHNPMNPGYWSLADDSSRLLAAFACRRIGTRPIRTGIITNWGPEISRVVAELNMTALFDVLCFVDQSGYRKPDREYFLRAAGEMDLPPGQCVHVGDSYGSDALGALQAGFFGVWLHRGKRDASAQSPPQRKQTGPSGPTGAEPKPPPQVATLDEFLDWIQKNLADGAHQPT